MLQLPPDSVTGGYAGGFDIDSFGGQRQISLASWIYTGVGDNFFGPAGLWVQGTSGSDQFFITLCIASAGDPGIEPCIFAQLRISDPSPPFASTNMQYQTPVDSIVVPHKYCLCGTADLDANDVHLYIGDEVTPLTELTVWAGGYPVIINSGTTVTTIGQLPIIDEADQGYNQGYDRCIAMGRIMSLAELRDWQFSPRNLAGCLGYFEPVPPVAIPGGFKSSEGKALNAASDYGAPQDPFWGFYPDANYRRTHMGY